MKTKEIIRYKLYNTQRDKFLYINKGPYGMCYQEKAYWFSRGYKVVSSEKILIKI